MSPKVEGLDYYLGCGDDNFCSILSIDNAQEHDGWTAHDLGNGNWGFRIRGDSWALDVMANGEGVFANPDIHDSSWSVSDNGQLWGLFVWSDDTSLLFNTAWQKTLDVENNVTPFVNSQQAENLLGQHWYFRSVEPQTTTTSTTTTTVTENAEATSTTTITVTTCLDKVTAQQQERNQVLT